MWKIKDNEREYIEKTHQKARKMRNEHIQKHRGERHEGDILENAIFLSLVAEDLHRSTNKALKIARWSLTISLIAIGVAIVVPIILRFVV